MEHDVAGKGKGAAAARRQAGATSGHPMLTLQRGLGNRATRAILAREASKTTMKVSGLGEVPVDSWSFDEHGSLHGGGGAGAHRVEAKADIRVRGPQGKLTASLFQASLKGKVFKEVVLTMRKGNQQMTITLKDVLISNYHGSGGDGSKASDEWVLNYDSIEFGGAAPAGAAAGTQ